VKKRSIEDIYALSPLQEGMLFHTISAPESAFYFQQFICTLKGAVDTDAFKRAWQCLVDRHAVLRTCFVWERDGEPVQVVLRGLTLPWEELDWQTLSDAEQQEKEETLLQQDREKGFDLSSGPPIRFTLIRLSDQAYRFVWTFHHILFDGWSLSLLESEVFSLYNAFSTGIDPSLPEPRPFRDYITWLRQQDSNAEEFWRTALEGFHIPTNLRAERAQKQEPDQKVVTGNLRALLSAEETAALRLLSSEYGVTLNTITQGAWALLLSRYSGESDVLFGATVSGRPAELAGVESMIGLFINTLPVRVRLSPDASVGAWLKQLQRDQLEARQYQHVSLMKIQQWSEVRGGTPLFESILVFENFPVDHSLAQRVSDSTSLRIKNSKVLERINYPLTVDIRNGNQMSFKIMYDSTRFPADSVNAMLGHLMHLLAELSSGPTRRLSLVEMLTEYERQQVVREWNQTEHPYPDDRCLHEFLEDQAERTPDATAVVFVDDQLTYSQLNRRANQLAHYLRRSGVGPEVRVGLCLERGLDSVVGLIGILKAGGVYVPLDPSYPKQRLEFMLEDAQVAALLSQRRFCDLLRTDGAKVVLLDECRDALDRESWDQPASMTTGRSSAYVIYTSGSSGVPKGVLVEHHSGANLARAQIEAFDVRPACRVLQFAPLSFDASVSELLMSLLSGATLCLGTQETLMPGPPLIETLQEQAITTLTLTPSVLASLPWAELPALETLIVAGESCSARLAAQWAPGRRFINAYGPTEITVCASIGQHAPNITPYIDDGEPPTIGRPISNTRIYLLDSESRAVPVGFPGEICISGVGLARGYLNQPDLTALKFIPNSFSGQAGARIYRSGDLARYNSEGEIDFLGRLDNQLKVRGIRIEPGEIEAALCTFPAVSEAVVCASEGTDRDRRLVAYVVPRPGEEIVFSDLRSYLKQKLPQHMLPAIFELVDHLPLSPSGKIDRRALPAPGNSRSGPQTGDRSPATEMERSIADIWRALLGVEQVGIEDNFFDVGGNSLLMVRVYNRLKESLDQPLTLVDLFRYPTIASLAAHLNPRKTPEAGDRGASPGFSPRGRNDHQSSDVAVTGLAGRFPGADTIDAFWKNLRDGVESIRIFSDDELLAAGVDAGSLTDPSYVRARAVLDGVEMFDAGFFGYSPREAQILDPQHRLFLECSWEALEAAGYDPQRFAERIGVYAGVGLNRYLLMNLSSNHEMLGTPFHLMLGNEKDFLSTRVSYKLNLRGPGVTVQTACSSSLVAVHLACQSLRQSECDVALAGGVSIGSSQNSGYHHQEGGIWSSDGHCRAFDAKASGSVCGSGAGVVVLKRLSDALADNDNILAVIKGSAINNDGSAKVGYTAPGVEGQAIVISEAMAAARVQPETIRYLEAHGTGTELGDPIEIAALTQAYESLGANKTGFCAIGSVKTNIGHLDAAAGVTGLIKTVLTLKHRLIPPTLHFESANPKIDFDNSPFYVVTEPTEWTSDGTPRRAAVSSFGMGGTNAHVVLEEAPAPRAAQPSQPWQLVVLSTKSEAALEKATSNLAEYLKQNPDLDLADVAYTLLGGRRHFNHRRAVVCRSIPDAVESLESRDSSRVFTSRQDPALHSAVFMFPGGGAQYVNMGLELYNTEVQFRETVDECSQLFRAQLGFDIRELLYPIEERTAEASQRMKHTSVALPALFTVEYALARLWMSWGVHPEALIGHSLGEYTAACLSGVLSFKDAVAVVALRGLLFERLPRGSMLSLPLSEDESTDLLSEDLSLAAVNGPSHCVVSGPDHAIERLARELEAREVEVRRLHIDVAAHSKMVEPILQEFGELLESLELKPPQIPFISNLTGRWITDSEATDWRYWVRHLRHTVRFGDGVRELLNTSNRALLEVGPGQTLSALARLQDVDRQKVISSMRHPNDRQSDLACLRSALGQFWLLGGSVDLSCLYSGQKRRPVPLPTYPFERQRYWVEAVDRQAREDVSGSSVRKTRNIADWFYVPSWERANHLTAIQRTEHPEGSGCVLLFADECGIGEQLARRLRELHQVVIVRAGLEFREVSDSVYTIDPRRADDYDDLLSSLSARRIPVTKVVHLWSVTRYHHVFSSIALFEESQHLGFNSVLFLTRALENHLSGGSVELNVISSNLYEVTGEEMLCAEKSTVLGLCKVIPLESPGITCRSIDIAAAEPGTPLHNTIVAQLFLELESGQSETVVAYRGPHRWVQTFKAARIADGVTEAARVRPGGVYLITGGLGGVGLMMAEYLAREARAKLILLTRTPFPDRAEWSDLVSRSDQPDRVGRTIRRIQEFEEMGAEVRVAVADVADEAQLRHSIARACEEFGSLTGVIHAAGSNSIKTLQEISVAQCEEQFQPKVRGLYALDAALEGQPLDFALIVSSLSSVLGIMGLAAYPAAHVFMDTFALAGTRRGSVGWMSVNWDNWLTKRKVEPGAVMLEDELYMTADEGLEVLNRILSVQPVTQLLISTGDLRARIHRWTERSRLCEEESPAVSQTTSRHSRPTLKTSYVAPRTEKEKVLAEIWQHTLGIEQVGIDDNYFDLGGDSVLAIHLISRARKAGLKLTPKQLFQHQTVAGLAAAADTGMTNQPALEKDAGLAPLTPIQQWFMEQDQPEPHHWNLSMLLEVREKLDLTILRGAARTLFEDHDALRLRFARVESEWRQEAFDVDEQESVSEIDLSALSFQEQQSAIEVAATPLQASLDLTNGPLARLVLFNLGGGEPSRLLIIVHHLISDVISLQILLEDLHTALRAARESLPVQRTTKTTSFGNWSRRVAEYARSPKLLEELDYWLSQAWAAAGSLPLDSSDGHNLESSARTFSLSLSSEETRSLVQEVAPRYGIQPGDALLTAVAQSLARWTGSQAALVNIEGHGREEFIEGVELWRTVGWFTTLYPVVLDVGDPANPGDSLKRVKEQLRQIPNRGIGWGLLRYLSGNSDVARQLEALPVAQVSFLYLGKMDQALSGSSSLALAKESIGRSRSPRGKRQHLLDISSYVFEGRLHVDLTYSETVHHHRTIENFAGHLTEALRLLISCCRTGESSHTPSDFPAARLSQEQLDSVIAELGRS
jgi:amino acid adenylation domain-containing protein/non-ribosomal peptide synthase protein (TIGR01720 family)